MTQSSPNYIAIIGDLVASREIENRNEVQDALTRIMDSINKAFADSILAKFTITIGDEFQGLVSTEFPLFDFYRLYHRESNDDIQTRFGVGLGPINTDLKEMAIGMDGPCFHHAREAIEVSKTKHRNIMFKGFDSDIVLDTLSEIIQDYEQKWLSRQIDVIRLYQETGNQALVGEKLGITRQSVNDIFRASKYNLYENGWNAIQNLIEKSGKKA